jgi:hypothetical protein
MDERYVGNKGEKDFSLLNILRLTLENFYLKSLLYICYQYLLKNNSKILKKKRKRGIFLT